MRFNFVGETQEIMPGVQILKDNLGFEPGDGQTVSVSRCSHGFKVRVGKNAEIEYCKRNDFFRALAVAADALKNGRSITIAQSPSFENCGMMLDASRGAVPKVKTVKTIMRKMALMGLNQLMLYTEDIYEMKKYPYFGYMRGRYTEEELKELDAYGEVLGIELVPCIQTLGHLDKPLRWSEFSAAKDTKSSLMVGDDATYELIGEMIKTMRRCFKTDKIHIGMDEATEVGTGRYLTEHGYKHRFDLLSEHLARVCEITEKYGFKPMMWSDLFFRLGSPSGQYYCENANLPENIGDIIPQGVTQVYWDYYNTSEKIYRAMISAHQKMCRPIVFSGGLWTWSGPSVNLKQMFSSTVAALKVCREEGVKDVFATLWGDDGSECDFYQAFYGMQLYAEMNYAKSADEENLDKMFEVCCGAKADAFKLLDIDDFDFGEDESGEYNFPEHESRISSVSEQALYQNPLYGLLDKNLCELNMSAHYADLYGKIRAVDVPGEFEDLFGCHTQLLKVLTSKCDMGIRLKRAYDKGDRKLLESLKTELETLSEDIALLCEKRELLWYKNNKPFGFENLGGRLVREEQMTRTAARRVGEFLDGKIPKIEELEQERLWYNGIERPCLEFWSPRIMTP